MRIVIPQPRLSYYVGGGEAYPLQQAFWLAMRGHKVTILTSATQHPSPLFTDFLKRAFSIKNIEVIEVKIPRQHLHMLSEQPGTRWYRWDAESVIFGRLIAETLYSLRGEIDIISTHMTTDSLLIPEGIKNVLHLHGSPDQTTDLIRLSLFRPDAFVAVSESVYKRWKPEINESAPVTTIRNGVDTKRFKVGAGMVRDIDVLYVGRFIENKGVDDIVRAVKSSQKVVFIGSGPLTNQIKKEIRIAKVAVQIIPSLNAEKLQEYYRRSKVFVCPSIGREGVLTTMLEAAASGCAIVTTTGGGMTDFAKNKKTALVIAPNRPRELSHAIDLLMTDSKLRNKLGTTARSEVQKKWSWESRAVEVEKFYETILKK